MEGLKEIRKGLKHGDIKAIAEDLGMSSDYISRVLREKEKANDKVIAAAIEMVDINKKSTRELQKRIEKVLSK